MSSRRVAIAGGGAAGFFAAIACARAHPAAEVSIFEKSSHFLSKVRISGGGRCNVTHACFDTRELTSRYPRGEKPLLSPFHQFQASDTVEWFESRGIRLKTESDGRMFPVTDSSQTIIDCLLGEARNAGVKLFANREVASVARAAQGGFDFESAAGEADHCDALLLATGGCRTLAWGNLAASLGHAIEPPVPSLFTFQIESAWLRDLAGISVEPAVASVPGTDLSERGAVLLTHWGLSGPAILRLSAWGARELHRRNYQFELHLNWLPDWHAEKLAEELQKRRQSQPAKLVVNAAVGGLAGRLWEQLVLASGISRETRWASLSRPAQRALIEQLQRTVFQVRGKSLNKDEFVTCGGVRLNEVNFKTMESRICPGLYFAGELLDIDGITGGFNFQSAWTTGWIAGHSMAKG